MAYGKYKRKWSGYNFVGRNVHRLKRFGATAAGFGLGFGSGYYFGDPVSNSIAGAKYGYRLVGKYKPVKGKHVFTSNKARMIGSNKPPLTGSNPGHRFESNPGHYVGSNPSGPIFVPNPARRPMARPLTYTKRRFKFAKKRIFS